MCPLISLGSCSVFFSLASMNGAWVRTRGVPLIRLTLFKQLDDIPPSALLTVLHMLLSQQGLCLVVYVSCFNWSKQAVQPSFYNAQRMPRPEHDVIY